MEYKAKCKGDSGTSHHPKSCGLFKGHGGLNWEKACPLSNREATRNACYSHKLLCPLHGSIFVAASVGVLL